MTLLKLFRYRIRNLLSLVTVIGSVDEIPFILSVFFAHEPTASCGYTFSTLLGARPD